ncbi:MAG TPA: methyl-accepting chemotaxis protein [Myxococcales bacterium]|nr:methyl-accepting chemotaxis protein [Myxococcales bacterium]
MSPSSTTDIDPSTSRFRQIAPRTLRGHAFTMLFLAVLVAALSATFLIGPLSARAIDTELTKRGDSLALVLERHRDLRTAVTTGNEALATELSTRLLDDPEVRYVVVVNAEGKVVGGAASDGRELSAIPTVHQAGASGDILRFTQRVRAETPSGTPDDSAKELGKVLLALSAAPAKQRLTQQTLAVLVVTAVTLGLGFMIWFQRMVKRLDRLGGFAAEVAAGKLAASVDDGGEDEIAALARSLDAMAGRSGAMVLRLQTAAQALARSSDEIFTSSTHQGESATRQAASVSETGATVAELRETFKQAAERAQAVIDLAKRSEESTSTGKRAVEQSVTAMESIRDQVLAISKVMNGLVDRTNQIGTIIDAVNDLAEQSNVLALNAAIEAAKAGEQGRGFAVVAREVRSLAERSKDSTAQVRAILQDIEKASREALAVIEEGTRVTQAGMELASRAGESIALLDNAIGESSTAAKQIAASTRQQAVGVEQIWQAMRDIDRAVNESASGIRQLEAASRNMKELSNQMTQLVAQYQVGPGE